MSKGPKDIKKTPQGVQQKPKRYPKEQKKHPKACSLSFLLVSLCLFSFLLLLLLDFLVCSSFLPEGSASKGGGGGVTPQASYDPHGACGYASVLENRTPFFCTALHFPALHLLYLHFTYLHRTSFSCTSLFLHLLFWKMCRNVLQILFLHIC